MTKPSEADLYEALHTACGLLERTAWETDEDGVQVCANCGDAWEAYDVGGENEHTVACDIPDVFAVRDQYRAALEREEREKEFGPKCKTCRDTRWVAAPSHPNVCPDCTPEEVDCDSCDGWGVTKSGTSCLDCDGTGKEEVAG